MAHEREFIDEWDVRAPILAVFRALCDVTTYPQWWKPVYLAVDADGPLRVGRVARERVKGRFPHELSTQSVIVRLEPPRQFEVDVWGDLCGRGIWTLSKLPDGLVHVRFDCNVLVSARQRPLFRWNYSWAMARAVEGLEPYARASVSVPVSAAAST